jgi:3-deoxy-manno-octulosonate cytidylyltransferase (CMP-KDO synthetase)
MKILGFIPARYHSTRYPGKPLVPLAGKPLIRHVYERAELCPELLEVYVATDDERILACVHGFGGKAVMTRGLHRCGTDRIAKVALEMGLEDGDLVVNVQGDQPFFEPSLISRLLRPLLEDTSLPMSTLKYRIRDEREIENPNHVKVVTDREGCALYFSRAPIPFFRDAKSGQTYYRHLGFYGFRMGFLAQFSRLSQGILESAENLEQLRALENGFRIRVIETPFDAIAVDVPDDIQRVEALLQE